MSSLSTRQRDARLLRGPGLSLGLRTSVASLFSIVAGCGALGACATAHEVKPPPEPHADKLGASAPTPPPTTGSEEQSGFSSESSPEAERAPLEPSAACRSQCRGSISAELISALRISAGESRTCYDTALRENPKLAGKLTVQVRIGPMGRACSAQVTADSLGDPAVASCVTQIFESAKFPAPAGACVDTVIPLNFVAKQ